MKALGKIIVTVAAVVTGATVALMDGQSIVNPQPFTSWGFTDASNNWVADDWTNYYTPIIWASPDLQAWHVIFPDYQQINGHFCFVVPETNGAEFYRAQFVPIQ